MKIIKKTKNFLSLDMATILLFVEAFFFLGWVRILKSIPFAKVAPSLGQYMGETPTAHLQIRMEILLKVSDAIAVVSRHTWWESRCFVMAVAGMKMLERRQIESTLYMGMARSKDGKMTAHAWLRSGSFYVTGAENMDKYTVVAIFAKNIDEEKGN